MQRKETFRNLVHLSTLVTVSAVIMVIAGCSSLQREGALSDSGGSKEGDSLEVEVMSFNIAGDVEEMEWENRKGLVADIIRRQLPDVVGLQEAILVNIRYIIEAVGGYAYYGVNELGQDNDEAESLRLLYRTDRWEVDESNSGIFWFTSTPEVPGSKDWGALWIRDCVFARLVDKDTNEGFYVYNSHWSYASQESRSKSARLLVERIQGRKYDEPFVAIGDFNARKGDESIMYLKDSDENPVPMKEAVYNRVDWIFSESGKFEIVNSEIIDNEKASDHKAISAMIRFNK
jgi:endonuclease/exonuclease/phosphatase family metal-dependent hydrolase